MTEPVFPDKRHVPTDADLVKVLGPGKRRWDALVEHALASGSAARPEWKFYSPKSGWSFIVRGKKRNLLYLRPEAKRFLAAFAFSEKAVQAAEQSDLPAEVIERIRQAPQYPEGRAVRVEVASARDLKVARTLLDIKLSV